MSRRPDGAPRIGGHAEDWWYDEKVGDDSGWRDQKEAVMSISRTTEIKASSTIGFDDALKKGIARAVKTLKNVRGAWIQNQEVLIDDKGGVSEYRVQLKVTFILEE